MTQATDYNPHRVQSMTIDYCGKCGLRVTESDSAVGAVEIAPRNWLCRSCAPAPMVQPTSRRYTMRNFVLPKSKNIARKKTATALPWIAGGICAALALILFLVTYNVREAEKIRSLTAYSVPAPKSDSVFAQAIPHESFEKREIEPVRTAMPKEAIASNENALAAKQVDPIMEVRHSNAPQELTLDLGNGVTMEFVYIKPGTFVMGGKRQTEGRFSANETPKHRVTITKGFYLGKYEVTQAQYQAITGANPTKSTRGPTCPVDSTDWKDSIAFCEKVSEKTKRFVRLPTEAEWEYACRAGTDSDWSSGDDPGMLNDYAWFGANAEGGSHPVGQKKPNAWGLYDMHGNVCERVADRYDSGYYASSPKEDPTGANASVTVGAKSTLLLRGGTWKSNADDCSSGARLRGGGFGAYNNWGFRVAMSSGEDNTNH